MKKLWLEILFILLSCLSLASTLSVCQKFCLFVVKEYEYEPTNIDEEFKWCKNMILRVDPYSGKTLPQSKIPELLNNGNFSFANVYVKLEGEGDQHFNNETINVLRSITGISLRYNQNITSFEKIRKELPHLKMVVDFSFAFYPNRSEINTFLKEHIQDFHAVDYLICDKEVDFTWLSSEMKEKFVLEFDELTLAYQAKTLGIKAFVNGIKHVLVDINYNLAAIITDLTFQEKTDAVDRNFVCPISASAVQKLPEIYCYYQLPTKNNISFLSPNEIPSECNRIIVRGIEIFNGTINFKYEVDKSYMEALKNSTTAKIIASLSCKNFYLLIGPPVNQSTLISNFVNFVESYNLEGLEIDCEHIHEIESYTDFLKDLKTELGSSKILGIQTSPCNFFNGECNPLAKTLKSICAINSTAMESLDYYRIKTSSPSFFESINYIMNPNLGKSNRTKKLVAVSSHGVFFNVIKHTVKNLSEIYDQLEKKKSLYPLQYDYSYNLGPGGDNITEIGYESTLTYKQMCTKWPEIFSQNSTILNSAKFLNNLSKYDSNSNNFFVSVVNGKLYYDNSAIMKYYSTKNINAIAFDSLNDDDREGACGQGKFPVFKSFFNAHL